ncbi:MAG: Acyltransferase 3 [Pedosphaera sp.]|nr:Acyltransferase 3 [Pedosphaera sp.]
MPPESESKTFHLGYRPSLDGVRGISILWVLGVHANVLGGSLSIIGVILFFVLSGFLITTLLVEEWDTCKDISLRNFYLRRALRLLPALMAMLVAYLIYSFMVNPRKDFISDAWQALAALLYWSNWSQAFETSIWDSIRHTWSLSVEEQFYFIWPLLLLLLLRRLRLITILRLVVIGAILCSLTRFYMAAATAVRYQRLYFGLDTRADDLLMGVAIAIALSSGRLPFSKKGQRMLSMAASLSAIVLVMGFKFQPWDEAEILYSGWLIMAVCGTVIIAHLVTNQGNFLHWILENRILVYLGRISYGLYLWHYPIFRAVQSQEWPQWKGALVGIAVTAAATLGCYYLVELPCLKLKKRFTGRGTERPLISAEPHRGTVGVG